MRTVWSAKLTEPLRPSPVFASTRTVTVALPVPDAAEGCSQPSDEFDVHEQADEAVCTCTDTVPPDAAIDASAGETVK